MIKIFENFQSDYEIDRVCDNYGIFNYTINPDKTINVNLNISFHQRGLTRLPLRFKEITGYFDCSYNKLITLDGCPTICGWFNCNENNLTSLVGGPKKVDGNYSCNNNKIRTFHGFPEYLNGLFYCGGNPIVDVWLLFRNIDRVELLNEMDPLRVIDDKPHVILDIFNDFLSIIGKPEVQEIEGYINI